MKNYKTVIYLIILSLCCACSPRFYSKGYLVKDDMWSRYTNDSLCISDLYPGDYRTYKTKDSRFFLSNRKINKILKEPDFKNEDLFRAYTFIAPYYNVIATFYPALTKEELVKSVKHYKENKNHIITCNEDSTVVDLYKMQFNGVVRYMLASSKDHKVSDREIEGLIEYNYAPLYFDVATTDIVKYAEKSFNSYSLPNYLGQIDNFKTNFDSIAKQNQSLAFQLLATFYSWAGEEKDRNDLIELWTNKKLQDSLSLKDYEIKDAKDYILSQTQNHQVVMFNEHHMNPENRIFFSLLLDSLYNQGFRDLYVETLACIDTSAVDFSDYDHPVYTPFGYRDTSVISLNAGYYSKEPEFANMLKKAKSLGFHLIAYEDTLPCESDCNNFRDSIQAKNIINHFTENHRKVLVYAGHGHIEKAHTGNWKKMAERFEEETGEDVLAIEQALLSNFEQASQPFSTYLNEQYSISRPSLVFVDNEPFRLYPTFYDLQVVFPTKNTEWRNENLIKNALKFEVGDKDKLVYIYPENEDITRLTVPYCIRKIEAESLDVYLEKGDYKYIIVNKFGEAPKLAGRLTVE